MVAKWFKNIEVTTMFIEPSSPWVNGFCESFNSIMRDNFLNGELFDTLLETRIMTERWRQQLQHGTPAWVAGRKATSSTGGHHCSKKDSPSRLAYDVIKYSMSYFGNPFP